MNAFAANASLVLHPRDTAWQPDDPEEFIALIRQTGLAGEAIEGSDGLYLAGEKFLELVVFMGCSPSISFTPGETGKSFTAVRITTTPEKITALTSRHSRAPLCPHCKKPVSEWREHLDNAHLTCPSCGQSAPPWDYNWRRSAGFARCFVEITDVFPKEAIPQPGLLAALSGFSHGDWQYFYYQP